MTQAAIYALLLEFGCTIVAFEDHPSPFGNWGVRYERDNTRYEITGDNREGYLIHLHLKPNGEKEQLRIIDSRTFDEAKRLAVLTGWLKTLPLVPQST